MSGEDNIGKKIRDRLADHATPVSGKVWEGVKSSLPGYVPVPSPLASSLSNAWMKLLYAISATSIATVLTFVVPTFTPRLEGGGDLQSAEKPIAVTPAPPRPPAMEPAPLRPLKPSGNSHPMAASTETSPSPESLAENLSGKEAAKPDTNVLLTEKSPAVADSQPAYRVSQPRQPALVSDIPSPTKERKDSPAPSQQSDITTVQPIAASIDRKKNSAVRQEKPDKQRLPHVQNQDISLRQRKTKQSRYGGPSGPVVMQEKSMPEKYKAPDRSSSLLSSDKDTRNEANQSLLSQTTKLTPRSLAYITQSKRLLSIPIDSIPLAVARKSVRKPLPLEKQWSLDLLLNPAATVGPDTGSDDPSGIQLSGGVRLNYHVSKHVWLSSGVWLDQTQWQNVYEVIYDDHDDHYLRSVVREKSRAAYVGIPLTITYGGNQRRLGYSLTAGVQFDVLTGSQRGFSCWNPPVRPFPWLVEKDVFKTVVPMVTASAGLSYALSSRVSLLVGPRVSYTASSVFNTSYPVQQRLWQVGLTTGFRIAL